MVEILSLAMLKSTGVRCWLHDNATECMLKMVGKVSFMPCVFYYNNIWAKGLNKHIAEENTQMGINMKKCSASLVFGKLQIQIISYHYLPSTVVFKKTEHQLLADMWRHRNSSLLTGMQSDTTTLQFLTKWKSFLPHDLAIVLTGK